MQAKSFWSTSTVYSADSVEFSPHHPSVLAVGTYQIETPAPLPPPPPPKVDTGEDSSDEEEVFVTPPAKRKGRCLIYDVQGEVVTEQQRIDGPAILDMKWNPRLDSNHGSVLGLADAEGRLVTYRWDESLNQLQHLQTLQVASPTTLVLSLDWSNRITSSSTPPTVITSLSSLELSHLTYDTTGELTVAQTWAAHDYEPWVASFDGWDGGNVVYSGGDDCKLKAWDVRTENDQPLWTNSRFDAGVTCIQTSPHTPNLVAVGSYNETLTLLDPRSPLRPLASLPLGGGAWRIKFHPSPVRNRDLVVACMHGGFKVFRLDEEMFVGGGASTTTRREEGETWGEGWELIKRLDEHESLAYGVDWSRIPEEEGEGEGGEGGGTVLGSCSFYDHEAKLWRG
ncbi:WD40-repeat-containing domain protein [Mrakia frigida]|uniref:diphthamide synthase n=1 Tax=Mrakia frigida TaxID=29902 RepID=UPI003FCC2544